MSDNQSIHPLVTWITLEEARAAWDFKGRSAFRFANQKGYIRLRKSGKVNLVMVADLVRWFGPPHHPIEWEPRELVSD